jgi:curli production assembly/transport component CsgG
MLTGAARTILTLAAFAALGGCAAHDPAMWQQPSYLKASPTKDRLAALPPPGQKLAVAVYGFTDQTGQFKHSDSVQTLSRAVTQGATSILVKTLQDTGGRGWFQVIERERLDNVLRERAVIREMRSTYLGERTVNPTALPPLLFAGVLLEGGIIGYDSNTKTGGAGARFLGIGGSTQYREDTITIYLRAVSVKTGEVLSSVSVRKSIASIALSGNAFRFVDFKDLLEAEAGVAYNEPDEIALTQAIEKAVYALIMEGALNRFWCFAAPPDESAALMRAYLGEREHPGSPRSVQEQKQDIGPEATGACSPRQSALGPLSAPLGIPGQIKLPQNAFAPSRPAPLPAKEGLPPVVTLPDQPRAESGQGEGG